MSGPLATWNDGAAKPAIVDFVERVTTEGGPDYVPPAERIAVFDNDGTLWCEKPMPIELGFILQRLAGMADERHVTPKRASRGRRRTRRLRVAGRGDHEALSWRRRRGEDADGRHPPGVRRP